VMNRRFSTAGDTILGAAPPHETGM